MDLHDLKPNQGAKSNRKRVGRGTGSGKGKTSGRGTKGQGSRAGGGTSLYHQGGNLPFFRRLPFKRGFTPLSRQEYNEVNVDQLEQFPSGGEVTPDTLDTARLLRDQRKPVVLLGRGEIKQALYVKVHRITKNAKEKIEAAGGSVELITFG